MRVFLSDVGDGVRYAIKISNSSSGIEMVFLPYSGRYVMSKEGN